MPNTVLHRGAGNVEEAVTDSFSGRLATSLEETVALRGYPRIHGRRQGRRGVANVVIQDVIECWYLMGCWLGERCAFPPFESRRRSSSSSKFPPFALTLGSSGDPNRFCVGSGSGAILPRSPSNNPTSIIVENCTTSSGHARGGGVLTDTSMPACTRTTLWPIPLKLRSLQLPLRSWRVPFGTVGRRARTQGKGRRRPGIGGTPQFPPVLA